MPETLDITSDDISAAVKAATPVADPSPAKTSDTTDPTPVAAIVPPAKSDEHGPLPFERHHAILSSTREEYEEKLRKTAWAERYDPRAIEKALSLAAKYEQDQADRAKAATAGTAPQPDLRAEDGTPLYSASQAAALARFEAKQVADALREEFGARVQPFETEYQERERINRDVSQIQEALTWKGFEQHMPVVTKAIAEANAKGQTLSVRDAYILHVVPLLADASDAAIAKQKEKWLAELNETTNQTTNEVIPGRTPASSRKKDSEMSISELYADETAKRKAVHA